MRTVLDYVWSFPGQEADWSGDYLDIHSFSIDGVQGRVTGLEYKRLHDCKLEVVGRFVYHEGLLPPIAVRFKCDARLSSFDDAFDAT